MMSISGMSFGQTSFSQNSVVSSTRIYKTGNANKTGKPKKRLPYNFKQLSKQIQDAKTVNAARPVVQKMRSKLTWLYKQLREGEYGSSEVFSAILHAEAMERIAKRKVRHLEEEEAAENGTGNPQGMPGEDEELYGKDELEEAITQSEEISQEMLEDMMEEIEELEEELASDMMSEMEDMLSYSGDMSEEEIKEMKRKHRDDEDRQLTRADLKYLKVMFERLEQEKRSASAISSERGSAQGNTYAGNDYQTESMPDMSEMDGEMGEIIDLAV